MFQKPSTQLQDNSALFAALYEKEQTLAIATEIPAKSNEISYFSFNPNTVDLESLISLGFKENVANTLINFRSKGGKFYQKEDLLKVYGVNQELYDKLNPYINIPSKKVAVKQSEETIEKTDEPQIEVSIEPAKKVIIELNEADSTSLTKVKGIGPVFASRIVKYRNLLGGFASKDQLKEVYGIDDKAYEKIAKQVLVSGPVQKINVNVASWQELVAHPYIDSPTANILLNYKKAHGEILNFDFILESKLMSEEQLAKITAYLTTE